MSLHFLFFLSLLYSRKDHLGISQIKLIRTRALCGDPMILRRRRRRRRRRDRIIHLAGVLLVLLFMVKKSVDRERHPLCIEIGSPGDLCRRRKLPLVLCEIVVKRRRLKSRRHVDRDLAEFRWAPSRPPRDCEISDREITLSLCARKIQAWHSSVIGAWGSLIAIIYKLN